MGRRRRRGRRSAPRTTDTRDRSTIASAPAAGGAAAVGAAPNPGTLSEQQSGMAGNLAEAVRSVAGRRDPKRARNEAWARKYGQSSGAARPGGKHSRRGIIDRGRAGRGLDGGGFRNRAFGMGREQRGFGMGREGWQGGGPAAFGMGREDRGMGMGRGGDVAHGGQRTFAHGAQEWGRGGTGGWGGMSLTRGIDAQGNPIDVGMGGQVRNIQAQQPVGRQSQAQAHMRRKRMRNMRRRFMQQQAAGQGSAGFTPATSGGGGGFWSGSAGGGYYGGGAPPVPDSRDFAPKKMGTTQGAFRIGNPAKNIASKNNKKLAINQKS
jgi:hypothetical protein